MRIRKPVLLLILISAWPAAFFLSAAAAEIHRAESLEWLTVDSDLVLIGKVNQVRKILERTENPAMQQREEVVLEVRKILKGAYSEQTIVVNRANVLISPQDSAENWKTAGDLLFFLKKISRFENLWEMRVDYPYGPIALTNTKQFSLYIVSQDMTSPEDGERILKIVQDQAAHHPSTKYDPSLLIRASITVDSFNNAPNRKALVLEAPEDSEAFKNLYGGSSVEVIVPAAE